MWSMQSTESTMGIASAGINGMALIACDPNSGMHGMIIPPFPSSATKLLG